MAMPSWYDPSGGRAVAVWPAWPKQGERHGIMINVYRAISKLSRGKYQLMRKCRAVAAYVQPSPRR